MNYTNNAGLNSEAARQCHSMCVYTTYLTTVGSWVSLQSMTITIQISKYLVNLRHKDVCATWHRDDFVLFVEHTPDRKRRAFSRRRYKYRLVDYEAEQRSVGSIDWYHWTYDEFILIRTHTLRLVRMWRRERHSDTLVHLSEWNCKRPPICQSIEFTWNVHSWMSWWRKRSPG